MVNLENEKFNRAKTNNDYTLKILTAQSALVESMQRKRVIPEKYKMLSESNIQNAKIHINKLIKDDV